MAINLKAEEQEGTEQYAIKKFVDFRAAWGCTAWGCRGIWVI